MKRLGRSWRKRWRRRLLRRGLQKELASTKTSLAGEKKAREEADKQFHSANEQLVAKQEEARASLEKLAEADNKLALKVKMRSRCRRKWNYRKWPTTRVTCRNS